MKSIPNFLRGYFRNALKFALEEASFDGDPARSVRGWKLLVMLPRMFLHRRPGGCVVSKAELVERFKMFVRGQWDQLIRVGEDCDERAAVTSKSGLQGQRHWCKSVNCRQQGRLWRVRS